MIGNFVGNIARFIMLSIFIWQCYFISYYVLLWLTVMKCKKGNYLYIFTRIRFYDVTSYFNTFRSSWNGNIFNGYCRYFSMRNTILFILAKIKTDDPTMALCIREMFSVLTLNFETILIILNRKPYWRYHNLSAHFLNYKILRHCWRWPKSITIGKYHNVRR